MRPELREAIEQRERVLARVHEMLTTALQLDHEPNEIDPDTPLFGTGLGLDSVDAVEIIVALESEFGVYVEETEGILALRTVNTLADAILEGSARGNDD